jgi:hypothetical protein
MIRSPNKEIEVAWVPKHQLRQALNIFKEFIYKGVENDEEINLGEIIVDLFKGDTKLGIIYKTDHFLPIGSWFSDIRIDEDQNYDYVTIYGLSGKNPNDWAQGVKTLVESWAKEQGCYSYRWYGRLAWSRYIENIKLLETINSREGLFEKVVQQ